MHMENKKVGDAGYPLHYEVFGNACSDTFCHVISRCTRTRRAYL